MSKEGLQKVIQQEHADSENVSFLFFCIISIDSILNPARMMCKSDHREISFQQKIYVTCSHFMRIQGVSLVHLYNFHLNFGELQFLDSLSLGLTIMNSEKNLGM